MSRKVLSFIPVDGLNESSTIDFLYAELDRYKDVLGGSKTDEFKRYTRGMIDEISNFDFIRFTVMGICKLDSVMGRLVDLYEPSDLPGSTEKMNELLSKECGFVFHAENLVQIMNEDHPLSIFNAKDTLLETFSDAVKQGVVLQYFRVFNPSLPCYENRLEELVGFRPVVLELSGSEIDAMKLLWSQAGVDLADRLLESDRMDALFAQYSLYNVKKFYIERTGDADLARFSEAESVRIQQSLRFQKSPYYNDILGFRDFILQRDIIPAADIPQCMHNFLKDNLECQFVDKKLFVRVLPTNRPGEGVDRAGGGLSKDYENILSADRLPYLPATLLVGPVRNYNNANWEGRSGVFLHAPPIDVGKTDHGTDKYGVIFGSAEYKEAVKSCETEEDYYELHKLHGIDYKGQYPSVRVLQDKLLEITEDIGKPYQLTRDKLVSFFKGLGQPIDLSNLDNSYLDDLIAIVDADRALKPHVKRLFKYVLTVKLKRLSMDKRLAYFQKPTKPWSTYFGEPGIARNECVLHVNSPSAILGVYVRFTEVGIAQAKQELAFLKDRTGLDYPCFSFDQKAGVRYLSDFTACDSQVETLRRLSDTEEILRFFDLNPDYPRLDALSILKENNQWGALLALNKEGAYTEELLMIIDVSVPYSDDLYSFIVDAIKKGSQATGIISLYHLAYNNTQKQRLMGEAGAVELLADLLQGKYLPLVGDQQEHILGVLLTLVAGGENKDRLGESGVIPIICRMLRSPDSPLTDLQRTRLLSLLYHSSDSSDNHAVLMAEGVLGLYLDLFKESSESLVEMDLNFLFAAVSNLTRSKPYHDDIVRSDFIAYLLTQLSENPNAFDEAYLCKLLGP